MNRITYRIPGEQADRYMAVSPITHDKALKWLAQAGFEVRRALPATDSFEGRVAAGKSPHASQPLPDLIDTRPPDTFTCQDALGVFCGLSGILIFFAALIPLFWAVDHYKVFGAIFTALFFGVPCAFGMYCTWTQK